MKIFKALSTILAMLMLIFAAIPCTFAQAPPEEIYLAIGEATDDGIVNIKDATAIQKHLAGIITLRSSQLLAADTNGDGIVNIKDATTIQKHLAGFSTESAIGTLIVLPQEDHKSTPDESIPISTEPAEVTVPSCTGCDIPLTTEGPLPTDPCETVPTDPKESTPDTVLGEIYHNVECSMRVTYYDGRDSVDTVLHLVKSPEELKSINSGIKVTMYGDGTYTTPDISDEYTEEFFEDFALIISLNCVGGSCCHQSIDKLTVAGKVLTLRRTLYHPEIMLADMNWQYVLIRVKAEDVENISELADDTTVLSNVHFDPTEPPTQNTKPTETPVHTEPASTVPTQTEPSATQKPTQATIPAESGNVPFSILEEGRVTDYKGSDATRLLFADSREKAQDALAEIVTDPYYTGSTFLKPTLGAEYDEEYFKEHSLIISLNCVGGSNCHQSIDKLTFANGVLAVHRTLYKPMMVTCDMNYQYVLIEVNNKDIGDVTSLENHNTFFTIEDKFFLD